MVWTISRYLPSLVRTTVQPAGYRKLKVPFGEVNVSSKATAGSSDTEGDGSAASVEDPVAVDAAGVLPLEGGEVCADVAGPESWVEHPLITSTQARTTGSKAG